jgi:hypothetical protein
MYAVCVCVCSLEIYNDMKKSTASVKTLTTLRKGSIHMAMDYSTDRLFLVTPHVHYISYWDCTTNTFSETKMRVEGATSIAVTQILTDSVDRNNDTKDDADPQLKKECKQKTRSLQGDEKKNTILLATFTSDAHHRNRIWGFQEADSKRILSICPGVYSPRFGDCDSQGNALILHNLNRFKPQFHNSFLMNPTSENIRHITTSWIPLPNLLKRGIDTGKLVLETEQEQKDRMHLQKQDKDLMLREVNAISFRPRNDSFLYYIQDGEIYYMKRSSPNEMKCKINTKPHFDKSWNFRLLAVGKMSGMLYVTLERNFNVERDNNFLYQYAPTIQPCYNAIYRLHPQTGHLCHIAGYIPPSVLNTNTNMTFRRDGAGAVAQFGVISSLVVHERIGKIYVADVLHYAKSEQFKRRKWSSSHRHYRICEITIPHLEASIDS